MMEREPPLPLEGEGAGGWGVHTGRASGNSEAPSVPSSLVWKQPASTPSQPSPLEGEGYRKRQRIVSGGIARGRRMRSEPTHAEAGLWKHLRRFSVRFRRQAPIGPYVVDFVCHRARLVVEVDGGIHERPDVALRDVERQQWLTSEGYNVMRFTNRQVDERPDEVCAAIRAALPAAFRAEN